MAPASPIVGEPSVPPISSPLRVRHRPPRPSPSLSSSLPIVGRRASHFFLSSIPTHARCLTLFSGPQAPTLLRLVARRYYCLYPRTTLFSLHQHTSRDTLTTSGYSQPNNTRRSLSYSITVHSLRSYSRHWIPSQAGPEVESPTAPSISARPFHRIFLGILGGELASSCSEALSFPPCCSLPALSPKHTPHATH
jgi:hypothetical protein